jgi:hypothetical protein
MTRGNPNKEPIGGTLISKLIRGTQLPFKKLSLEELLLEELLLEKLSL